MNKRDRAIYWRRHNALLRKYEKKYLAKVKSILRDQIRGYNGEINIAKMYEFLIHIYGDIGKVYAKIAYDSVMKMAQKKRRPIGFNELIVAAIINEYKLKLLNESAAEIDQTTRDIIQEALTAGQLRGLSLPDVLKEVLISGMVESRARMILRTELNKAANYAEQIGVDATGLPTNKIWVATNDDRTRDSHRHADGQKVEDGKPFTISGQYTMQRPGDSRNEDGTKVPAKEIINCRCVIARELKRELL